LPLEHRGHPPFLSSRPSRSAVSAACGMPDEFDILAVIRDKDAAEILREIKQ
jgi:hypothetical protein